MEVLSNAFMVLERVSVVADGAKFAEVCSAFDSLMGPTRAQGGCVRCELYRSWQGPNTLLFEGLWRTREDLVRHLRSDRYKSFLQLMETSIEPPVVEFFFVSESRGLQMVEEVREKPTT
jgi:quinol monooxygenase YgiN